MALAEWHLTPEYINTHWTEELWALMMEKRALYLAPKTKPKKYTDNATFFQRHAASIGYHHA